MDDDDDIYSIRKDNLFIMHYVDRLQHIKKIDERLKVPLSLSFIHVS